MVLIAIDSVYQLVNAMNIAYNEFPEEHIVVLIKSIHEKTFKREKMNKNKFVHSIYYTNKKYEKHIYEIMWQIWALLFPRAATSQLFNDELIDLDVSAIIASTTWIGVLSPVYRSYANRPKLYFIEEGLGTYVKQELVFGEKSKINLVKFKMLRRQELVNKAIFRFTLPEYMLNQDLKFQKPPYLSNTNEFKYALIDFFGGRKDVVEFSNSEIIYFEQVFNIGNHDAEKAFFEQESLIRDLLLSNRNAKVKSHPRYFNALSNKYPVVETITPWEAVFLSIDINNKILISISSTSLVTPKIMQNKEPIVICLVKIFRKFLKQLLPSSSHKEIDNIIDFFYYIKTTYNEPERFKIPNSVQELNKILMELDNA
jgi:hypothetical protein